MEKAERVTNREFAQSTLKGLIEQREAYEIGWATTRQASKYRNQKGRVYKLVHNK